MAPTDREIRHVVLASSVGTIFEWYDFYLFGALAPIIASQYFGKLEPGTAWLFSMLALSAAFVVRPVGALLFGRIGDMAGRKYTFLITITVMGLATFMVGVLPGYNSIGIAAPVMLLGLRLLQGLAMGGEYGGAAIYVAEYAHRTARGASTAWIQLTASLGLVLSLVVVLGLRTFLGESVFLAWGWRVPFLLSAVLLAVSVFIRLGLSESPVFVRLRARGRTSRSPLKDAFGQWRNLRLVIIALLGLTAGQAVVWYGGQVYALTFLTQTLGVDEDLAGWMMAAAICLGGPFFVVFGALSDRVGRKWIVLGGCLLASLSYFPVFGMLTQAANPQLAQAMHKVPVRIAGDAQSCTSPFSPNQGRSSASDCDLARQLLGRWGVSYRLEYVPAGTPTRLVLGERDWSLADLPEESPTLSSFNAQELRRNAMTKHLRAALAQAGYPQRAERDQVNRWKVVALLSYLVMLVAMVYGPMAAILVEMFPTRIRYTAMSLPYHIGNGWFGGLLPGVAFASAAHSGNIYSGLWYPVLIAGFTFVVGALFLGGFKDEVQHALTRHETPRRGS